MNLRPTLALTAIALLLGAGCTILPQGEPATLYRLPASTQSPTSLASAPLPLRLGVAAPEAGHLLGSNRIVVYPERNVVNVYEGARWYDDAPDLLQTRLISGLQQFQLFANVGSDRLPSDVVLLSELRHFQSEYDNIPPSVNVQLDVQLVGAQSRKPITANSFATRVQASSVDIPDVVDAFGRASDALTEQLAAWLEGQASDL
ncbi:ABC-type transport auxiliary lipoprotein family protein [Vreelandella zhaodongensis]|uniref:Membrane integrity-associated transporter subunit PqiC n=1 Tax=Vreelandella zhaodongensis TaxID=1176240 RepID=A0ABX2SPC7_VREZH|nr:ABC-type transport auxiliary lipoprotein family protein [Halomonas zhaodongensis]NYS43965.1 membrane integrity-associated transporter subunit PqiC [Halomonas zhaodongensis]